MDINFLIKGTVIGFSIAAPVGPIGILCIRRSLTKGHLSGFVTGMGAASADMVYGVIAAFGLTFISSFLVDQQLWLKIIGMIFLFYLGIKTFLEKPQEKNDRKAKSNGLFSDYLSTFFLTIINPMTILSFAAVFAGLGLGETSGNYISASILVLGVFIGSALWWIILSNGVGVFRKKIKSNILGWVNKISGSIIIGFALVIFASLVKNLL